MVGHHIEISNRFLHDFEATIFCVTFLLPHRISGLVHYYYCEAMQGRALPQASLIKGRFGGIVDMTEDISPPPATKTGETLLFLLL